MTVAEFVKKVDHTILKPNATYAEVREAISYAKKIGAASICLYPVHVSLAHGMLKNTQTKVCTVIGFPFGANTTASKAFEAEKAHQLGAQELDLVVNIGALLSGDHTAVRCDIKAVVNASPALVKVVLENCYLSEEQISTACRISEEAGASFVRTSTGFGIYGARVQDVQLMQKSTSSPNIKIKASGGIYTLQDAVAMLDAGAVRLGLSRTLDIISELEAIDN